LVIEDLVAFEDIFGLSEMLSIIAAFTFEDVLDLIQKNMSSLRG
jgi:hypothetical protein